MRHNNNVKVKTCIAHGKIHLTRLCVIIALAACVVLTMMIFQSGTARADGISTVGSGFFEPTGVAVDSNGNVYVADRGNSRVVMITPDGVQTTIGSRFSSPQSVAVLEMYQQTFVFVADAGRDAIIVIQDPGDFSEDSKLVYQDSIAGVKSVSVDGWGSLFVLGKDNKVRHVTFSDGDWGQSTYITGSVETENTWCSSFAVDAGHNVFLAEPDRCCVDILYYSTTRYGRTIPYLHYVDDWGLYSPLVYPYGVCLDSSGVLYVVDFTHDYVTCYAPGGIKQYGSGLVSPEGIAVDSKGIIYVADTGNDAVKKIDNTIDWSVIFGPVLGSNSNSSHNNSTTLSADIYMSMANSLNTSKNTTTVISASPSSSPSPSQVPGFTGLLGVSALLIIGVITIRGKKG